MKRIAKINMQGMQNMGGIHMIPGLRYQCLLKMVKLKDIMYFM